MHDISTMDRFCVVCGLMLGRNASRCCTQTSLVATRERGFFKKTRQYFDITDSRELNLAQLTTLKEKATEEIRRIKAEEVAKRAEDGRRKAEDERRKAENERRTLIESLPGLSVPVLENYLCQTRHQSVTLQASRHVVDYQVLVMDRELRQKAARALADMRTEDAVRALRRTLVHHRKTEPDAAARMGDIGTVCEEFEHDETMIDALLRECRPEGALIVKCRECSFQCDVTDQTAGTQVTCLNCGKNILLPSDATPEAWGERLVKERDWTGLISAVGKGTDIDPWTHEKKRVAQKALHRVGAEIIEPVVEMLIHWGGYSCLINAGILDLLVSIGDQSAGPFLKVISDNYEGGMDHRIRDFAREHGATVCNRELLGRLSSVYRPKESTKTATVAAGDTTPFDGKWNSVSNGMSKQEVHTILGKPDYTPDVTHTTVYGSAPEEFEFWNRDDKTYMCTFAHSSLTDKKVELRATTSEQTDETVKCTCGATTTLRWDGRRWHAVDPTWTFKVTDEGRGWSCGRPGHKQAPRGA